MMAAARHDLNRSVIVLCRSDCYTRADAYVVYPADPDNRLGEEQVPATMESVSSYGVRDDMTCCRPVDYLMVSIITGWAS